MGTIDQPGHRRGTALCGELCIERLWNLKLQRRKQPEKPGRHIPTDGHTHKQSTAPTLTTSIAREIYAGLAPIVPPQTTTGRLSSSPPGPAPPQLRLQSNQATHGRATRIRREKPTTEVHAATRAPLDTIIVAKQKPAPRLSKPRGEDATIHGEDATIHQSPSRSRLRDDASKEEKDAKTPPSPDPPDLRLPSGAKSVGRRSTPPRRRFQERSRHPQAPPLPPPMKTRARISPGDDHLQPPTAAHQSPPLPRPTSPWPPTIHRAQARTTPWS
ncbi:hypothetical protein VPH35_095576 [Triticum aestivum]